MTIPTLTPTQIFQNSVNQVPQLLASVLNANSPQSFVGLYNRAYNAIFANADGSATSAITNLGAGAANVLAILAALNTFLTTSGVTGLAALPAYTANNDGTVTLS